MQQNLTHFCLIKFCENKTCSNLSNSFEDKKSIKIKNVRKKCKNKTVNEWTWSFHINNSNFWTQILQPVFKTWKYKVKLSTQCLQKLKNLTKTQLKNVCFRIQEKGKSMECNDGNIQKPQCKKDKF